MSPPPNETVTITARCLCNANIFAVDVPKSNLPLHADICHCGLCRHMTGALYSYNLNWPGPKTAVDISSLKTFHCSPRFDLLFCPTCSTPMFYASVTQGDDDFLKVFAGVLDNQAVDLVTFDDHKFVHSTLDGGASVLLKYRTDGSVIKRFAGNKGFDDAKEVDGNWPALSTLTSYEERKEDHVPIRCQCKGIDLVLDRGDYSNIRNGEFPDHIDPETHKLEALLCACDSCRLQSGIDIFCWTYSEIKYISFGGSSTKSFPASKAELKRRVDAKDASLGSLVYYSSSPGSERYFCSNCSACVFFAGDSQSQVLSLAVGLLHASDGARAEGLLSWPYGARINERQDVKGGWREKWISNMEKDAEGYRVMRGYPKNWQRVAQDAAYQKSD